VHCEHAHVSEVLHDVWVHNVPLSSLALHTPFVMVGQLGKYGDTAYLGVSALLAIVSSIQTDSSRNMVVRSVAHCTKNHNLKLARMGTIGLGPHMVTQLLSLLRFVHFQNSHANEALQDMCAYCILSSSPALHTLLIMVFPLGGTLKEKNYGLLEYVRAKNSGPKLFRECVFIHWTHSLNLDTRAPTQRKGGGEGEG